jgi:hypothetical protein
MGKRINGLNTLSKDFARTLIFGVVILAALGAWGALGAFGLVSFLIIFIIFNCLVFRVYKPEENIGIPVAA